MRYSTLISAVDLEAHITDTQWVSVDCSFDLADVGLGRRSYYKAHIPGAVYAGLDDDLSGLKTGANGRHPLPNMDEFKMRLGRWGIDPGIQVVVYDQDVGMYASRLWWMLRYLGHEAAAVLDGGMAQWLKEGRPTRAGAEQRSLQQFEGAAHEDMRVTVDDVKRLRSNPAHILIDVRAPERYRGEQETLDPVAGHIPGAVNHFYENNLNPDGTFLTPNVLKERLKTILGDHPPQNAVVYCGSGVTACHGLLALEHAGFTGAKLYVGSWSEWCADPGRPVAIGSQP